MTELPVLIDRTYADFAGDARARIPSLSPDWTDHNPSDPGIAVVRLFSYPGWRARVNGDAVAIESWSNTCVVAIPVPAGKSQLEVTFCRTPDRTVGALLSISAAILAMGILFRRFSRNFFRSRAR